MNASRREFLSGAAAIAFGGWRLFAAPPGWKHGGKPNLVFGVVSDTHLRTRAMGSDLITTVAGVYDILSGMRRCRIKLPNRCYHLISRVAHRAMTKDGRRRIERVAPL